MGASESTEISVNFNRPTLFYYAGEQIAGTISFRNTQDKLTVDQIFLDFTGELGYTTQETRRHQEPDGRTRTENYTEHHRESFFYYRFPVVQPQYGQREITLYRGNHSWPFEFVLPPNLPPSSSPLSVSYPYVAYRIQIVLDKPWYKANTKQIYTLMVFPRVDIYHRPNPQTTVPFSNHNRKKLQLQGSLIYPGIIPGKKFPLHIQLSNPKRSEVKRVEVTLTQFRAVSSTRQSEIIFRMDLPGLSEFNGTEFQETFELQMPGNRVSPTYSYNAQCRGRVLSVIYSYELTIDVKSRGLFTDFKVTVPVVVGTEPPSEQQTSNNYVTEMVPPSAPLYNYDEPPPSYESIVGNGKM